MYRQLVFIFLSSSLVLRVAATCTQNCLPQVSCPTFWTAYRNHCYRLFAEQTSWVEANKNCGVFGAPNGLGAAYLVTLHSAQEQEVVLQMVREVSNVQTIGAVHIGFTDVAQEGVFEWVDGKQSNYLAWIPNEPSNGGGGEDCTALQITRKLWNDIGCHIRNAYVCKMPRF